MEPESSIPQPTESTLTWATPKPMLIAVTVGGVLLAGAAVLSRDGASRLLIGLAATGLLGLALLGFRQRPRLAIRPGPEPRLLVRSMFGAAEYGRDQIQRARIVSYRRLGRKMPMLEIDVDDAGTERLLIFGRWDLGAGPEDVFDALVEHGLASLA
ncbi:PH domain-containing protein [Nocardia sp. NPDC050712]|uniref:PH domain-containing protein n=1 Tax=Nocardia sp. NPDC050712 TaxID=3155518 RepID=UPI0033CEE714